MELIIIGLVTAANFLILKGKVEQNRWADLAFDIFVLATLSFLFSRTLGGLTIAMVGSFTVSVYLYFYPPNLKKIFSFVNTASIAKVHSMFKKILYKNNR